MPCTPAHPCGGLLYPDVVENETLASVGFPQRAMRCLNAHSFWVTLPAPLADPPDPALRTCLVCGTGFRGKAQRKTCSEQCRSARIRSGQRVSTKVPAFNVL